MVDNDFIHELTSFLKDCVGYYENQSSFSKSINDKDWEMWNAGQAEAYQRVLNFINDYVS